MIEIIVSKNTFNCIVGVEIKGHANQEEYGKDIVCSAISTLGFTLINATQRVARLQSDQYHYTIEEDGELTFHFEYMNLSSAEQVAMDIVTRTIETGFIGVMNEYKKYIHIMYKEV